MAFGEEGLELTEMYFITVCKKKQVLRERKYKMSVAEHVLFQKIIAVFFTIFSANSSCSFVFYHKGTEKSAF